MLEQELVYRVGRKPSVIISEASASTVDIDTMSILLESRPKHDMWSAPVYPVLALNFKMRCYENNYKITNKKEFRFFFEILWLLAKYASTFYSYYEQMLLSESLVQCASVTKLCGGDYFV